MSETKQSKAKLKPHYVDNKKFLVAMIEHREKVQKAEDKKRKPPMVTNYIGECFLNMKNGIKKFISLIPSNFNISIYTNKST